MCQAELEQKGYDMEHKSQQEECQARTRIYEENKSKAFAVIWCCCSRSLRNRIEEMPDYQSKTPNNPFELRKAIKDKMCDPTRAKNDMALVTESTERALNA